MKIFSLILFSFLISCTENPFFDDQNIKGSATISGTVIFEDRSDHSEILIWIEEYEIFTFSDQSGNYTITIPEKSASQSTGITDYIDIYYYFSNYQVATASIFVFNGTVKSGEADLDENGKVKSIALRNVLHISSEILPETIGSDSLNIISVTTTLSNNGLDLVNVITETILGSVTSYFVKSLDNSDIYQFTKGGAVTIGRVNGAFIFSGVFRIRPNELPAGNYEVFPYLFVEHRIPDGLLDVFGYFAEFYTLNNLNIPVHQNKAILTVH